MGDSRVAVVTDSTANIPADLVKKYKIHVIPQCLNWEDKTYLDGVDITPNEFYARLGDAKELPTTSQPSAGEFHEFFNKLAEDHDAIVGVFISEFLSGTIASATAAVEMMPDFPVEVVDSRSASMGLGFMILAVARALEDGKSPTEAAGIAEAMKPLTHAIFVVDTLEFLHRGGRIGGANRLLGSMLSIKPVLHLENGKIEPLARVRTKRKALAHVLDHVAADIAGRGAFHASVIHAAAPQEAAVFSEQVRERFSPVELFTTELSPVVGTHTGPGLVGLGYYTEPV
jgi:DegV family protein with EDD domain